MNEEMKKLFLYTIFVHCVSIALPAQNQIQSISKAYLRTHPFDSKFSTFILNLQKDPWFKVAEYNRRTNSSFFFLKGTYQNFNPFRFKPTTLTLIVAEEEIIHTDSLQTHDTIMNLQLIGMIDGNLAVDKTVEKELKKFHQAYAARFDDFTTRTLKWEEKTTGEIYSYFISPLSIAPVTIAWGILPNTNQYSFTIIIRFKVAQNQAVYILQPGE